MAAVNLVHTAFESADGRTAKVWLGEAEQDHGLASREGGRHGIPAPEWQEHRADLREVTDA